MKKSIARTSVMAILATLFLLLPQTGNSQVVVIEAIASATKKVIRAIDLKIQRLQNRTIDLQNAQKQIENALAKLKLDEISDWTRKQKELYQQYFDELWRVKTAIAYYQRITDIIQQQKRLIAEYRRAFHLLEQDKHFSPKELEHMQAVYAGIIEASLQSIDGLFIVIKSFSVQMSDAARLEIINNTADQLQQIDNDLSSFTNQNIQISQQRAKDASDLKRITQLYGLKR